MFKKATKKQSKMRVLLEGASGSGKTYSALTLASAISDKIAVIDTERGSASLYSDTFDFDVLELTPPYSPERFIEAIRAAEDAGYEVIVMDSITHEWKGEGGCLDIHGQIGGNSFAAWKKVTPRHDKFVNAILGSSCHVICTCRSKADYQLEDGGRKVIKQGTSPEQRDGLDFEMTLVFDLNQNNLATASKDRTNLFRGYEHIIDKSTGKKLMDWLNSGEKVKSIKDQVEQAANNDDLNFLWSTLTKEQKLANQSIFSNKKEQLTNG